MVIVTNVKVNSFYIGHYRDLELASSLARVRNSESSFQSNVRNLFFPGVFSYCPFYRGVRYTERGVRKARVDYIYTENTVLALGTFT